ncbi:DUF3822 family protein [Bacteroides sp. 214]|uniref:DUF3822 family protein n=1 Tax=Bacteroides sp. 214 TaxID=2302935 RepID=UPI0013D73055|nr:DUF3822 family protein [Bacteroides sp. 214]NDW13616.1 DUF3822 family protein [Bacteroides sp. 214]
MSGTVVTNRIDFSKSEQYTLSIRLATDGFSFSVYDPITDSIFFTTKEVDPLISFTANLKRQYKENDFLIHRFKRTNVLLINKRYTFVPLELFEEEQAEVLFYYNHPRHENEIVLYNVLKKNNIVVLFGVDKSVHTLLSERFESVKYYSQTSSLIEHFAAKSRLGNSKKMYAYMREEMLELYCFERGTLLLANSFICKKNSDRLYYLLYVWKQLQMDQERDELHLAGFFEEKNAFMNELKKFVKKAFVINTSSELNNATAEKVEEIPLDMQLLLSKG